MILRLVPMGGHEFNAEGQRMGITRDQVGRSIGAPVARGAVFGALAGSLLLGGCLATAPSMGTNKGTVSGSAAGGSVENNNQQLVRCDETLGTLAVQEDTSAPWYYHLHDYRLGSTVPVLRLMIQQSNCFVIVERGRAMDQVIMGERKLEQSGELRNQSNFGKGQLAAADYTMSPSVQFADKTSKIGGMVAGLLPIGRFGALAGDMSANEASTTLLLLDNRSGVQIAAAEGTARNFDFGFFGAAFTGALVSAGGYSNTPQGKVVTAAFADSYNQMVKSLRNYQAQTVKGGLGTGGKLGVQGGTTPASKP
jgi:Curli production assembly/transport component CsgG